MVLDIMRGPEEPDVVFNSIPLIFENP
jgi:hypothetical protein